MGAFHLFYGGAPEGPAGGTGRKVGLALRPKRPDEDLLSLRRQIFGKKLHLPWWPCLGTGKTESTKDCRNGLYSSCLLTTL